MEDSVRVSVIVHNLQCPPSQFLETSECRSRPRIAIPPIGMPHQRPCPAQNPEVTDPAHERCAGRGQVAELIQRRSPATPRAKEVPKQDAFLERHCASNDPGRETASSQRNREPVA